MNDEATEHHRMRVVRDPTFVRFVADQVVFTPVGNDVEVSFMQMGAEHRHFTANDEFGSFESEAVLAEVARMRMNFPDMLGVAMNFIRGGILEGRLRGQAIRDSLDGWIAEGAGRDEAGRDHE